MRIYAIVFMSALLLSGCCGILEPQETGDLSGEGSQGVQIQEDGEDIQEVEDDPAPQPTGDGVIIDVADPKPGVAYDQQDCATLSADCSSCVAKENCGWCKRDTAGCFYGDEDGPIGTAKCAEVDWAYSLSSCQAPAGGGSCSDETNCADCLSGEGCKWCIQGSVCTDAKDGSECFGTWMTESFQCLYASR
jgi:hypothetical protein